MRPHVGHGPGVGDFGLCRGQAVEVRLQALAGCRVERFDRRRLAGFDQRAAEIHPRGPGKVAPRPSGLVRARKEDAHCNGRGVRGGPGHSRQRGHQSEPGAPLGRRRLRLGDRPHPGAQRTVVRSALNLQPGGFGEKGPEGQSTVQGRVHHVQRAGDRTAERHSSVYTRRLLDQLEREQPAHRMAPGNDPSRLSHGMLVGAQGGKLIRRRFGQSPSGPGIAAADQGVAPIQQQLAHQLVGGIGRGVRGPRRIAVAVEKQDPIPVTRRVRDVAGAGRQSTLQMTRLGRRSRAGNQRDRHGYGQQGLTDPCSARDSRGSRRAAVRPTPPGGHVSSCPSSRRSKPGRRTGRSEGRRTACPPPCRP